LTVFSFELSYPLLLRCQRLSNTWQARLLGFKLSYPTPYRRFAKLHVFADMTNAEALLLDHLNDLELEARVEGSPFLLLCHIFRFRGGFHLSVCP
jgi:hypothetical protein